ncbi:MAG: hypothetical protein PHH51_03315 [Bacilli bacterium]|nr:hypothetical protein [Bacilli bacterium]MDD3896094.1 hypothetical protein [Bacilli bacterium]MDD4407802.1 hypothetical protein [Bacilli bacterium]
MKLDTVVELESNKKYYILDETIQNDKKYFLATKLDENEEMTAESTIFEENKVGEDFFLKEVTDDKTARYILSVFTTTLINEIEDEKKED